MAAEWTLMGHDVALTWLADVDKSQIWAVRSGSGGPDLFVPVGLKLLIYTVDCRSDGWGRVDQYLVVEFAGGEEGGGAAARSWTAPALGRLPGCADGPPECGVAR